MIISHIVAVDRRGGIGIDNQMPWVVDGELARFKRLTMGRPVIMGRKTFQSLPQPLVGRQVIVISRSLNIAEDATVVTGIEQALALAGSAPECFVAGGGQIYRQTAELIDKLYLSRVDVVAAADTHYDLSIVNRLQRVYYSKHHTNYHYSFASYVR